MLAVAVKTNTSKINMRPPNMSWRLGGGGGEEIHLACFAMPHRNSPVNMS